MAKKGNAKAKADGLAYRNAKGCLVKGAKKESAMPRVGGSEDAPDAGFECLLLAATGDVKQ